LPFILAGLIIAHLITLHEAGGSNPIGTDSKLYKITFNPYYTLKDVLGFIV
jgi:ubiquinol-cytochrome c reductase cytochrome b subunit